MATNQDGGIAVACQRDIVACPIDSLGVTKNHATDPSASNPSSSGVAKNVARTFATT